MMVLGNFDFEKANKLDWSNPHLDVVIAMRLLLFTYETRPEAEPFRTRRHELNKKYSEAIENLPELAERFRKAFPLGPYGVSREETSKTLSNFAAMLGPAVMQAMRSLLESYESTTETNELSDHYLQSYLEYMAKYAGKHKQYGGVLKLDWETLLNSLSMDESLQETLQVFRDPRTLRLLKYQEELVRLYYEYGLKCWWAPCYFFVDDLARWAGPVPPEQLAAPTLDGMLGPLFRREVSDTLQTHPGDETLSMDNYYEWLLLAMSRKEMQRELGLKHARKVHETMERWGYKHGHKWEQADFDMLFDRLYLGLSVDDIAKTRSYEPAVVQRRTAYLAKLLGLKLPRAPHKKHRKL